MTAAGELVAELRLLRADLVACRRSLERTAALITGCSGRSSPSVAAPGAGFDPGAEVTNGEVPADLAGTDRGQGGGMAPGVPQDHDPACRPRPPHPPCSPTRTGPESAIGPQSRSVSVATDRHAQSSYQGTRQGRR